MLASTHTVAIPPGETIKEQLTYRVMPQKEFALRMGFSEKHVSNLLNGKASLTTETAIKLESVLGIPASFWLKLESIYREKIARVNEENTMDTDKKIVSKFPYAEMSKYGWVKTTNEPKERVLAMRQFFEVADLRKLENPAITQFACRRMGSARKSDFALLAFAQKAKLEARAIKTNPINIEKLLDSLPAIRKMTTLCPSDFNSALVDLLSQCGVSLVFLPHIGGSFLHGATFMYGNKYITGISFRNKYADTFWFSLFHELAHIVKGHLGFPESMGTEQEKEADAFAAEQLIRQSDFSDFCSHKDFSANSIQSFADRLAIDVGIVVGRLQKEGFIPYSMFNNLRRQYAA